MSKDERTMNRKIL